MPQSVDLSGKALPAPRRVQGAVHKSGVLPAASSEADPARPRSLGAARTDFLPAKTQARPANLRPIERQTERLDVQPLMDKFYLLLSMDAHRGSGEAGWHPTTNHKHAYFERRYPFRLMAQAEVVERAPELMRYLAAAVAGELARATTVGISLPAWMQNENGKNLKGVEILQRAIDQGMTYERFGAEAMKLFCDERWGDKFGGKAWRDIAEQMVVYNEKQPEIWLDHVFSLQHNGEKPSSSKTWKGMASVFKSELGKAKYNSWTGQRFLDFVFGEVDLNGSNRPTKVHTDPVRMAAFLQKEHHPVDASLRTMVEAGRNIGIW